MSPPPVSQLIEQEVVRIDTASPVMDRDDLRSVLTRIAEAAAREAVRYLAVGDSQEWAEDQVVQAVLGAEGNHETNANSGRRP